MILHVAHSLLNSDAILEIVVKYNNIKIKRVLSLITKERCMTKSNRCLLGWIF